MSHPVDELIQEHELIAQMLDELESRLCNAEPYPAEFFAQALDFFANFADGYHHFKEEDALFPALEEAGVPSHGGPIGVMLSDHQFGRACLASIRQHLPAAVEGSEEARMAVRRNAEDYIEMLRRHIWKENNVLFRIAQNVLSSEQAVARLNRQFHNESNPRIAPEVRRRYEELVHSLTGLAV